MPVIREFIVITGVDGCGKSTVIEQLQARLGSAGLPVQVVARQNPNTSTPRVEHEENIQNHRLPPRSAFASALKLAWNALAWWREYLQKHHPHTLRGCLLIGDRFYFDELTLDPLKYRFGAPAWLVGAVRSLLPTPALSLLLDAPVEVLYTRKQENSRETVAQLREVYLRWAQENHVRVIDSSGALEDVVRDVEQVILHQFANKKKETP
jgi:thymidylate kinase